MRLLSTLLLALPALAAAQGSLTPPPGAPAPTMKTLDQVEPRIPIVAGAHGITATANGGFTITESGSYYLTGNLEVSSGDAISIKSSNVTLDLGGFTIQSASATEGGFALQIYSNYVTVRNGTIRGQTYDNNGTFSGSGFSGGIVTSGSQGVIVEQVIVSHVAYIGISTNGTIRACTADTCRVGFQAAEVIDSSASTCRVAGIIATRAVGCRTQAMYQAGIEADSATNCSHSNALGSAYPGIKARTAIGCTSICTAATGTGACGIQATTATNCYGESTSAPGIACTVSATDCIGITQNGSHGLVVVDTDPASSVPGTATNCVGRVGAGTGIGLMAGVAANCKGYGIDGIGLKATVAQNCIGETASGSAGLYATDSATNCRGQALSAGAGIETRSAIGCTGTSTTGHGITATTVSASTGESTDREGIICVTADNSKGSSTNYTGLSAATATSCYGYSYNGWGLYATEATGCHGKSENGTRGLHAQNTASGCTGEITTATCPSNTPFADTPRGLSAATAENCTGTIGTATGSCLGLYATTATNCTGKIAAGSDSSYTSAGLAAETATGCTGECPHCPGLGARVATNCTGSSTNSWGLAAGTATNCYGYSNKYTGLKAHGTATGCRGSTSASGTPGVFAIEAAIAVACTTEEGAIFANSKQLGTP